MTWEGDRAAWWQGEIESDPAYERDVDPVLRTVLPETWEGTIVDLGCGEGRLLDVGPSVVGIDRSRDLAQVAAGRGPVAVADAYDLPFADHSVAGAFAVLVIEHVVDVAALFTEVARVVTPGGFLALVANHPAFTAPGSGPFIDPGDSEVLWRWGRYLSSGHSDEPAGASALRFHHRPVGDLLTAAASAGWRLEHLVERSLDPAGDALLAAQRDVPRLLGARWAC